jgi:hypothetical protein
MTSLDMASQPAIPFRPILIGRSAPPFLAAVAAAAAAAAAPADDQPMTPADWLA